MVWFSKNLVVIGFQMSYEYEGKEKVLTWDYQHGFTHNNVDHGEGEPLRYKASEILVPNGVFPKETVVELFQEQCQKMDPKIAPFVLECLKTYHPLQN